MSNKEADKEKVSYYTYRKDFPNIIIILIDGAMFDYFSFNNKKENITPNLDNFAKKCNIFTKFYPVGTSTLSSVTSIYTSKYPAVHGRYNWAFGNFKVQSNIFDILKKYYKINFIGLDPGPFGFNIKSNKRANIFTFITNKLLRNEMAGYRIYRFAAYNFVLETLNYFKIIAFSYEFKYLLDNYLNEAKIEKKPIFLHVQIMGLHPPLFRNDCSSHTNRYIEKYLGSLDLTQIMMNEIEKAYEEKLSCIDKTIGDILKKIGEKSLFSNTLIVISSDHNVFLGIEKKNNYFFSNQYEVPVRRVPLFFYVPTKKGKIIKDVTDHVDIMPTILDFIKEPVPKYVEGKSLLPLMEDDKNNFKIEKELALNFWLDKNKSLGQIKNGILQIIDKDFIFVFNIEKDYGMLFSSVNEKIDNPAIYNKFKDISIKIIKKYNKMFSDDKKN